jgi:hypothetical protein
MSNVFHEVLGKMRAGEKISREEFGAFVAAQNAGATSGIGVGEKIPDFVLPDQDGQPRSFRDLAGRDGLLLVFSRSADW